MQTLSVHCSFTIWTKAPCWQSARRHDTESADGFGFLHQELGDDLLPRMDSGIQRASLCCGCIYIHSSQACYRLGTINTSFLIKGHTGEDDGATTHLRIAFRGAGNVMSWASALERFEPVYRNSTPPTLFQFLEVSHADTWQQTAFNSNRVGYPEQLAGRDAVGISFKVREHRPHEVLAVAAICRFDEARAALSAQTYQDTTAFGSNTGRQKKQKE